MTRFRHRWPISLLLGVALTGGIITLGLPRLSLAQEQETSFTLTLADLGYETVVLRGPNDSVTYNWSLPPHWLPQDGSQLRWNLSYAARTATGAATGALEVRLNGNLLHVENLDQSTVLSLTIPLPPESLRLAEDDSTNSLELTLIVETSCEDALNTTLAVESSSALHVVYGERPLPLDLALYPKPIYHRAAFETFTATLVLPPQPTAAELETLALVAGSLGAQTRHSLPLQASLQDPPPDMAASHHLVLIGTPERLATLVGLELPVPLSQRQANLSSQMPAAVSPAQPFSYTLSVENTYTTTRRFIVQDRLAPLTHLAHCTDCREITPGNVQWETGPLAPGKTASTTIAVRIDETFPLGEPLQHTASLLDHSGQVINVDTLGTVVTLTTTSDVVASPIKAPYFFATAEAGVPETDGLVQLLPSPWNNQRAALVITGLNDAAVLQAARALAAPGNLPGMHGSYAIVQATRPLPALSKPQGYDITLADLDYTDQVLSVRSNSTPVRFDVPRGAELTQDAYLMLHLVHGSVLNAFSSTLEIHFNNVPIQSISLQADNASDSWVKIPLPTQRVGPGTNQFNLTVLGAWPRCMDDAERDRYWVTLYSDSYIHLLYDVQPGQDDRDLIDYPRFLMGPSGLQDTVVLLSDLVFPETVQALTSWFSYLGSVLPGGYIDPRVDLEYNPEPEKWLDYHLVIWGRPTDNPYISLVNDQLPQPFIPGRDQILPQVGPVAYRLPPSYNLGLIQLLAVPWNQSRTLLLVSGTTDTGLQWAWDALADRTLARQMSGNLVALVNAQQVHATDTRIQTEDATPAASLLPTPLLTPDATLFPPTPTFSQSETPTPTLVPSLSPPTSGGLPFRTPTPILPAHPETAPIHRTPRWIYGLLSASLLVAFVGLGVLFWQRRA